MILSLEEYLESQGILMHYGTPRHSGRYPWGSGENGYQRSSSFLAQVAELHAMGYSEVEIARNLGMNTSQLRSAKSIAKNEKKAADLAMAHRLLDKGMSQVAVAERLGIPEPTLRAMLADGVKEKLDILNATTDVIRQKVDSGAYVDVGTGVEQMMGISTTKLKAAVAKLEEEGYSVEKVQVDQIWGDNKTTYKVVAPPGTTYVDIVKNKDNIQQIKSFSEDGGLNYLGIKDPMSISSDRIKIAYDEDGGSLADGAIYIRPGVDDISIGNARYAQVRVAVDGTHYMKGMAIYKDDLPDGVDILYNSPKSRKDLGDDKLAAMKPIKDDPDNPFGSVIRQRIDPETGKLTSAMNIVGSKDGSGEEGAWGDWSKNLSPQFLSKQSTKLAEAQLGIAYSREKDELKKIMELTNPVVKKKLLETYADSVDSAAVDLKAAPMPRQATHVILPVKSMKDTEVYAPNYKNGERVVLVRYPHGGVFEIPELTVNNKHPEAKKLLGDTKDAVGINAKVASQLSGADFDGDTVLVIPNNSKKIKTGSPLEGLKNFETKRAYPAYDGMKTIDGGTWNAKTKKVEFPPGKKSSPRGKGREMGDVSNLITDMSIKGASLNEIAAAVRHSMVVIDAEKHSLNYKQSAIDNNIKGLKEKYQRDGKSTGASTLISRATSRTDVPIRKLRAPKDGGPIDPVTGKKVYADPDPKNSYLDSKGRVKYRMQRSTKLAETDDAHTLVSKNGGTRMENIYADHSNRMKALANEARKSSLSTGTISRSPSAAKAFSTEVKSLDDKLTRAIQNRPLERQAQVFANATAKKKIEANPGLSDDAIKKIKYQALEASRIRTGAKKSNIVISNEEWNAIQAGAISPNKLSEILKYSDLTRVRELATPRPKVTMSSSKVARAKAMASNGATRAEIADALGVSTSTIQEALSS